jgi:hypothetical protein
MHFYSGPPMHFLSGVDSQIAKLGFTCTLASATAPVSV